MKSLPSPRRNPSFSKVVALETTGALTGDTGDTGEADWFRELDYWSAPRQPKEVAELKQIIVYLRSPGLRSC